MKLAEALQERTDLNRCIARLRERLDNNVVMQAGVEPVEAPRPCCASWMRRLRECSTL